MNVDQVKISLFFCLSQGYGMMHTLSKWSHLDFASHWVAFAIFLLSRVIL